jgi:hypothetical protein
MGRMTESDEGARVIEATRRKLREAEFFYQRLVDSLHPLRGDPEEFGFYLSAFITAARSVPWALQSEEKAKYGAWNPTWESQLTNEERELLRFVNERRLDTVKREGIQTLVEWQDIDIYELLETSRPPFKSYILDVNRQHPAYGVYASGMPASPPPSVSFVRPTFHFDREGAKEEAIETCKKYLDYLKKFLCEFLRAHEQGESPDG